jgi:hypothetical protein
VKLAKTYKFFGTTGPPGNIYGGTVTGFVTTLILTGQLYNVDGF